MIRSSVPDLFGRALAGLAGLSLGSLAMVSLAAATDAPAPPNLPLRYLNPPGVVRGLNSLAASEKTWIPSVTFRVVPGDTSGGFPAQIHSALASLDRELQAHSARRHAIVRLDVIYRADEKSARADIDAAFREYFRARIGSMVGEEGGIDYPVRSEIGKQTIGAGDARVILQGEFVDRENIDIAYLVDPEVRKKADAGSLVLFGGISPAAGHSSAAASPEVQVGSSIQSLRAVLAMAGMTCGNISRLTIYVSSDNITGMQGWVKTFDAALHENAVPAAADVEYLPVEVAGSPGQSVMLAGVARQTLHGNPPADNAGRAKAPASP